MNRILKSTAVAAALAVCLLGINSCGKVSNERQDRSTVSVQGKTMGTFYGVTVVGDFPGGEEALKALAESAFEAISARISTFDPKAELARFNEFKSVKPFPISRELAVYIEECLYQSRRIDEAMDITVGPLVNLWGFGKDKGIRDAPPQRQIDKALSLVGLDKFELRYTKNGVFLVKDQPDVRLDLSTVGEGIGADTVAGLLNEKGIKDYFVNVAGASRSSGLNPKGQKWRVGIEDPTSKTPRVFAPLCPLGQAVSTSGSYRNYFKDDKSGKIFSHVIDPKTGRPVDHQTLSVTVIARRAFETDALDTGLLVLGADKALEWAEKNLEAVAAIELVDGKPVMRYSKAFEPYLKCGKGE